MLINRNSNLDLWQDQSINSNVNYKQLFILLLMWLVTGIIFKVLSIPLLALFAIYLQNRGQHLYLFIIFFLTLILSDSRIYALSFAQSLKTVLVPILLVPFLFPKRVSLFIYFTKSFIKPFIPYVAFALFCIIFSPVPFTAFQKLLSYFLLLSLIPILFYSIYKAYHTYFLKALVFLGIAVLVAGYIMFLVNPSWVMYNNGGRSSGALGNPNGLGMFCFLFYMLYFTIQHYFPHLFSKRENVIIHLLIFSSLLWSGSRGQTLAVLIFLITQFLSKRNKVVGLVLSVVIAIMLISIDLNVVAIASALGFEDFLRVETLDAGGGRVVAEQFAWQQIQDSFWIGRGFDFTEYIYHKHFFELSMLGHEGNAHNTFLTVWLDTGLIGLILFALGWGIIFYKAAKNSYLAMPVLFAVVASNMVESWWAGSLNPFHIQLLMILTLLVYIVKDAPVNASAPIVSKRSPSFPQPLLRA